MKNNRCFNLGTLGFALWLLAGTSYAALFNIDVAPTTSTSGMMTWTSPTDSTLRLTAVAYSTSTNYAPNGYITTAGGAYNSGYTNCTSGCGANGNWAAGRIFEYAGNGIGMSNNIETAGQTNNDGKNISTGSTFAPQHAMDNNGAIDVAVFSMQKLTNINGTQTWVNQTFDPNSFQLGYTNNDSDVQAWAGGNGLVANYDFTNVCFQGCTGSAATLASKGFSEITNTISATDVATTGGDGANIPMDTTEFFTGTQSAQYVVMSGNLGLSSLTGGNDFFKISQLALSTGNGTAPVPGSVPLLALGLAALGFVRRRRAASFS